MVDLEDIKQTVGEVLQLGSRIDDFSRDTILLGNIPEFDSLAVVNLMTALEEKFDIYFDDDEVNGEVFASLGSLQDFVSMKLSG
ncbi:MAG: phosphopantetheine-binding protein [Sedimenticola sp.]|nr:phosphopantetheine-binding protein [Sedimenticola sp.]